MDWRSSKDRDWICRQLVREAPDAIIVADREGTIQLWSAGAERIFGKPASEAEGGSMDFIIPEKLRARHWEGYFRTMATGETKYGERLLNVPALTADGRRISIEFSVAMLRDENGRPAACAATARDVTERREKEQAVAKRLAGLEAALPKDPPASS